MTLGKWQPGGVSVLDARALDSAVLNMDNGPTVTAKGSALLYGAMAVGVLAGAAISTYLWRQRVRALNLLNASPLERAEEIIANCESKLEDIERAFENLKGGH